MLVFCLCVCFSVRKQDYIKRNERIYMKQLPEVCFASRNNPLSIKDDSDYNPDPGSRLLSGSRLFLYDLCLWTRNNPLNFGDDPV